MLTSLRSSQSTLEKVTVGQIRDALNASMTETLDGSEEFLPRSCLLKALSCKNIQTLLGQNAETKGIELNHITSGKQRIKIFAILILIGQYGKIGRFIKKMSGTLICH